MTFDRQKNYLGKARDGIKQKITPHINLGAVALAFVVIRWHIGDVF